MVMTDDGRSTFIACAWFLNAQCAEWGVGVGGWGVGGRKS